MADTDAPSTAAAGEQVLYAEGTLPEDLRLPDLSGVHTVSPADLERWIDLAMAAFAWGPDERLGGRRSPDLDPIVWINAQGKIHSPDPHTPAHIGGQDIEWCAGGSPHRDHDQPAIIDDNGAVWARYGRWHRSHAPAVLYADGTGAWYWQGQCANDDLAVLLDEAWSAPTLTEGHARSLLDAAEHAALSVAPATAQAWAAHVIAAHPRADLLPRTRAWARLLAA